MQKIDHLSFTEAVERLAARVGYELHYEQGGSAPRAQQGQRARLVEAHKASADSYAEQLTRAEFQKITQDLLDRTRQPFQSVIKDAGIATEK